MDARGKGRIHGNSCQLDAFPVPGYPDRVERQGFEDDHRVFCFPLLLGNL
jgi:hypothetical protein